MKRGKSDFHDYYMKDPTVVMYEDVMQGVDLAYTIRESQLKEDIILNSVPESIVFTFDISVQNLTMELKDGTFTYNDKKTGEAIFTSSDLFMGG